MVVNQGKGEFEIFRRGIVLQKGQDLTGPTWLFADEFFTGADVACLFQPGQVYAYVKGCPAPLGMTPAMLKELRELRATLYGQEA